MGAFERGVESVAVGVCGVVVRGRQGKRIKNRYAQELVSWPHL